MLWKCCTHYASKFGKLSSGHRTAKAPVATGLEKVLHSNSKERQCQRMFELSYNCTHFINQSADEKSKGACLWTWSWREHVAMTPGLQIMETNLIPPHPRGNEQAEGPQEIQRYFLSRTIQGHSKLKAALMTSWPPLLRLFLVKWVRSWSGARWAWGQDSRMLIPASISAIMPCLFHRLHFFPLRFYGSKGSE